MVIKMIRKIVQIDEEKCDGCGLCIPNCAEGAIKIINGKAKLISDQFCDGLGACLGHCPQDAITIIEREAPDFDEEAVSKHLSSQNRKEKDTQIPDTIPCGCPGSMMVDLREDPHNKNVKEIPDIPSELRQWPVQFKLVPPNAPYFQNADLLLTADCVPFAYANFHHEFLKGKTLIIGCPKLDDSQFYTEKLKEIIESNNIKSITLLNMEVPCCFGLQHIVEEAIQKSGKKVPYEQVVITIKGEKQQ
jgi:ferredoxin